MSNQYIRCDLAVAGLTGLVCKLLDFNANDDTVYYTSDSVSEQTNAIGDYVFTFGESSVIARQWWRIVVVNGSGQSQGKGYGYFFGVDGELVEGQSDPVRLPATIGGSSTVERESNDTAAITFRFPVAGATITATRWIGSASSGTACVGVVTFLETVDDVHFYSFAYDAADRPSAGGAARYKFTDGTYTVWVNFKSLTAVLDSASTTLLNDIPTTAEFEARTLAAASYATASQINSLQVNTRASVQVPVEIETPDSGTQVWKIRLFLFDSDGNMEAPDSTPTVALVNASGTDRSSRLSAATTLSTGAYSWDYTSTEDDTEEQLNWTFTVVEGGLTRVYPAMSYVVEETAYRFTSTDRATLNSRASQSSVDDIPTNAELATSLSSKASTSDVTTVGTAVAAVSTKLGSPAGASVSADIASIRTDTGTTIPGLIDSIESGGASGEEVALAILLLDWETITGEVPSRSTLNALRHIRNKWALDGNTKTVYAEDNTTPAFTTTVTADSAGNITADTPN